RDVKLCCAVGNAHFRGDLLIRHSSGDEPQYFALARAEPESRSDETRCDARIDVRLTSGHGIDRAFDLIERCTFEQIPFCARANRSLDILFRVVSGEHEYGGIEPRNGVEPADAGQLE